MKTFQSFTEAIKGKKAVFTFGRFNPPTQGHELLLSKVFQVARNLGGSPFVFVSQTQDHNKNPLSFEDKIKYTTLGMPFTSGHISKDKSIKTPFDAVFSLGESGFKDVTMIVGSDRVQDFQTAIGKYVGHPDSSLALPITKFTVVSAGERDPDADNISGLSASKMREAAKHNDFKTFQRGAPSQLSARFAKEMFDKIRKVILGEEFNNGIDDNFLW